MMVRSDTSDPEKKVVVWASTDSTEPGTLKLMLVNLSGDVASTQVQVSGFEPVSGEAYVMASSDPLSMVDPDAYTNHTTTINGVRIPDYEIANPAVFRNAIASITPVAVPVFGDFDYTLQPYTVVALTLRAPQAALTPTPSPAVQPTPGQPVANNPTPQPSPVATPTPRPAVSRIRPAIGPSSPTLCADSQYLTGLCTD
jgi:hypothetical protein